MICSLKSASLLAPFAATTALFFYLEAYELENHKTLWATVLKCLPIFGLAGFVHFYRVGKALNPHAKQTLFLGLLFSSAGDALLNYDLIESGMAAFAVAQICYIKHFGFEPLKLKIGIPIYIFAVIAISLFFASLPIVLKVGLPIYASLLTTMVWRSIARCHCYTDLPALFAAIGGFSFLISDSILGFDMFYLPIPNIQFWILATYYTAQLGITLSILQYETKDTSVRYTKKKSNRAKAH